ncbi:hypothetical protein E4T42_02140 [Aureobasidium subglaciale]|uniref:Uncharacterized protein n=1 Tax=Aureobasidium subglaciale (strain EXF-2481) TaxID=1043005 RepID=A0A074YF51_AURSE|nr:uncharacterized protein AUEXF2481DRAFT_250134 [Aureobasidium subglaciale EXF-2481]KAI5212473.1 hypothetical protein E4T38_00396 [Aureobasidium subglaciale]KAI5231780.1 hypothetical protein E4T40_00510 [Aureobasidium subglaciale]KAI5234539.1 hypothetical protein E4T41_00395 [Aureobasidium subglaciale]KAI5254813.1 hypothetical protein E4T42_02140 [Aureobasidium subglaciale]KAI5268084.1 hypothetical protein E4T46_00395 [Aureobasidium subglaciale]
MSGNQPASGLERFCGLVSFGHPPVDLCSETAAKKTVVSQRDLSNEGHGRALRYRLRSEQHDLYQRKSKKDRHKSTATPKDHIPAAARRLLGSSSCLLATFGPLARVFGIGELSDVILGELEHNDLMSCLGGTRVLRRAVQNCPAAQTCLETLPFEPAGQFYSRETCCLPFPKNSCRPMLVTKGTFLPTRRERMRDGKGAEHRVYVDVYLGSDGHVPTDFDILGSWADMKLPDMPVDIVLGGLGRL